MCKHCELSPSDCPDVCPVVGLAADVHSTQLQLEVSLTPFTIAWQLYWPAVGLLILWVAILEPAPTETVSVDESGRGWLSREKTTLTSPSPLTVQDRVIGWSVEMICWFDWHWVTWGGTGRTQTQKQKISSLHFIKHLAPKQHTTK